ncbi:MAG TPA: hypothetical protein VFR02_06495, partial [bacterium]|nr:hypothetical protein [bacterium]
KVLAFLIAVGLWAYVGSREVLDRRVVVHLQLTDIPAGMTVDSNVRTAIPVVLTGRKESILALDADDLTAVVSLRDYRPGKPDLPVRPLVRPLPPGVEASAPDVTIHLIPVPKPTPAPHLRRKKGA